MQTIRYDVIPTMGCDPELFIESPSGDIVGAEKAIPKEGLPAPDPLEPTWMRNPVPYDRSNPGVVLDGVQIELHPRPDTCRARMSNEISAIFRKLAKQLESKKLKASFNPVVEVSKEELESLSEESRKLGCGKSENAHDSTATISVDPETYLTRSAGGHIHLGLNSYPTLQPYLTELVWLLDALLGNTCVMIDRDPNAAKRREVYGRAGEYRLPSYGLEYRTLSNFWLLHYRLMSMVFGLARLSVNILHQSQASKQQLEYAAKHQGDLQRIVYYVGAGRNNFTNSLNELPPDFFRDHVADLKVKLDTEKVVQAINTNNLELAKENWVIVKDWLEPLLPITTGSFAVSSSTLPEFQYFLDKIEQKGLKYWFNEDPMDHWCNKPDGHGTGFESFLTHTVRLRMKRSISMKKLAEKKAKLAVSTLVSPPVLDEKEIS